MARTPKALSSRRGEEGVGSGLDARRVVSPLEEGLHGVARDALGHGVGDGTLQPVPDLHAHGAIIHEDEKDDLVVAALLADPPGPIP